MLRKSRQRQKTNAYFDRGRLLVHGGLALEGFVRGVEAAFD